MFIEVWHGSWSNIEAVRDQSWISHCRRTVTPQYFIKNTCSVGRTHTNTHAWLFVFPLSNSLNLSLGPDGLVWVLVCWFRHTHTHTHRERERERDQFNKEPCPYYIWHYFKLHMVIFLLMLENLKMYFSFLLFLCANLKILYLIGHFELLFYTLQDKLFAISCIV